MSNTCIIGLSPYISRRGWSWLTGLNGLPRQEFDWLENIVHFGYDSSSSLHRCVIIRPTSIATGEIRSKGDTQKGGTSRKLIYQTVRVSRQESNLRVAGSTKWCTNKTPPSTGWILLFVVSLPFWPLPLWWNDVELTAECFKRITRSTISLVTHVYYYCTVLDGSLVPGCQHAPNISPKEELLYSKNLFEVYSTVYFAPQLLTRQSYRTVCCCWCASVFYTRPISLSDMAKFVSWRVKMAAIFLFPQTDDDFFIFTFFAEQCFFFFVIINKGGVWRETSKLITHREKSCSSNVATYGRN